MPERDELQVSLLSGSLAHSPFPPELLEWRGGARRVAQVLRRYVARRQLDEARASQALEDLRDLDLNRYPHDVLLGRIWELRNDASAYDAAYLALAEVLGAPLLTSDARLRELPDVRAHIEVI